MSTFFKELPLSILWAVVGVVLLFLSALAFDLLYPIRIREEIEKGNMAVGVLLGAVTVGMAIIIATAIS